MTESATRTRYRRLIAGAAVLLVLVVGYFTVTTITDRVDTNQAVVVADEGATLADQVARVCARGGEAATALGSACQQANKVQDLPGATGAQGERGATGPQGEQGPAGATGNQGVIGPTGPTGPPGADGANGADGAAGPPGAAARGLPGQDGTDGAAGADGAPGSDGQDGRPPTSWTYTDALGLEHTCTRSNVDDASPTYTCT